MAAHITQIMKHWDNDRVFRPYKRVCSLFSRWNQIYKREFHVQTIYEYVPSNLYIYDELFTIISWNLEYIPDFEVMLFLLCKYFPCIFYFNFKLHYLTISEDYLNFDELMQSWRVLFAWIILTNKFLNKINIKTIVLSFKWTLKKLLGLYSAYISNKWIELPAYIWVPF